MMLTYCEVCYIHCDNCYIKNSKDIEGKSKMVSWLKCKVKLGFSNLSVQMQADNFMKNCLNNVYSSK